MMRAVVFLCLLSWLPTLPAADRPRTAAEAEARLSEVQRQMRDLRRLLEARRGEQGRLQRELRRQDREIARISRELKAVARDLEALETRLAKKRRERRDQLERLARHRRVLAGLLRATWRAGLRQEGLRLLLSQDDPARIGRTLAYYRRLRDARLERIRAVDATLADLRAVEAEIAQRQRELRERQEAQRRALAALERTRSERRETLARLTDEIRRHGRALDALAEDEAELQALIASLNEALADIPPIPEAEHPFSDMRGRLRPPVQGGRVLARFGDRRKGTQGRMRWNGLVIQAHRGRPVQAVARGRVAFADWMRGVGLLVILDHGEGFLSLYGHNEALYVEPGDWVEAGDIIATVGDSGGAPRAQLYFELRRDGRPVNPDPWFSRRLAGR